jgi:hypothetical protein
MIMMILVNGSAFSMKMMGKADAMIIRRSEFFTGQ